MTKNPFTAVSSWIPDILFAIKKDIKNDHLSVDKTFYKTHFGSRPINKLTTEEIFAVYGRELLNGQKEDLVEWAINRWVFKHGDAYRFFAEKLSALQADFTTLETISDAEAEQVLQGAQETLGASVTYLFSRLNGVVFSEAVFERLHQAAQTETAQRQAEQEQKSAQESLDLLTQRHQREMSRLQEKYEDKLAGVQRKYTADVEALKKQIRALQQKQGA